LTQQQEYTITQYAQLKNISRQAVFWRIKNPVLIGAKARKVGNIWIITVSH
jgi:hypothetical protein